MITGKYTYSEYADEIKRALDEKNTESNYLTDSYNVEFTALTESLKYLQQVVIFTLTQ